MKCRIFSIISALPIGLSLTACGSSEPASAPNVAESEKGVVE